MTGPATFRFWISFANFDTPFDDTSLASDANWGDFTQYVRYAWFSTSSRSALFDTFSAGRARFELDNSLRLFDPALAGFFFSGRFRRHVPVRVTAEHSSTRYTVWRGYVRTWQTSYTATVDSVTTIQATDGLGVLARYSLDKVNGLYEGDTAADRIGRVLDAVGVPSAWRDLNNGGATSALSATDWGVNALQHITEVVTADGGMFYVDRDGTFVHDSRNAPATETRQATSQQSFDDTTAPQFESLELAAVGENFRDLVRVSGESGTVQEVDKTVTDGAPVTFQKLNTPLLNDSAALGAATFYADLYSTDVAFPSSISTTVASTGTDIRTEILPRRVRDRIDVTYDPPAGGADITADCFIDGITHEVTPAAWRTTFSLSSADQFDDLAGPPSTWLIVGSGTRGDVDTNTVAY